MGVSKTPVKQLGSFTSSTLQSVAVDASVYVGAVVLMSGGTFINAIATSKAASHVFGICTSKSSSTVGDVLLPGGITDGIYSSLDLTKEYFLSDSVAGGIAVPPVPTTAGYTVWVIGKPYTTTRLLFMPELRVVRA